MTTGLGADDPPNAELNPAAVGGLGLRTPAETIHPYPTRVEAVRTVADADARG